jgi:crossover junction endodeoxyribonuclease RuvC
VDPGTVVTGWGVIETDGPRLHRVASGLLRVGRGDLPGRLATIYRSLAEVLAEHRPVVVSLERNFLSRNVQSAFRLGEARGVVMAVTAAADVALTEYTPATIKKAVVGHGRAAKTDVQRAVVALLRLAATPSEDEADALAAAACYALRSRYDGKVAAAIGRPGSTQPLRRGRGRSLGAVARAALARGGESS